MDPPCHLPLPPRCCGYTRDRSPRGHVVSGTAETAWGRLGAAYRRIWVRNPPVRMAGSTTHFAGLQAVGSPRPQEIPSDFGTPGQAAAWGTELPIAGDPDMTSLPCTASPASTATCPDTCHLPSSTGAGRRDETAPSGICQVPAGMSQAPFPARQCQGEGTPRRESWVRAGGDRRGWAGGRQGGRDGGSSRGGRGKDRQPAAWPHCPTGLRGASPTASQTVQPRSSLPGAPHRRPPPANARTTVCNGLHPGAGRGEHFSSGSLWQRASPAPPHMVPGSEPRGSWPGDALPPPASSAARLQPRRRRNAGTHVCELELMETDRMLRLHRFTGVCSPRTGGWWFFIGGWEAERERERGWGKGGLELPSGLLYKIITINTLTKRIFHRKQKYNAV